MKKLLHLIAKVENKRFLGMCFISRTSVDFFTWLIIFSALLMGYELIDHHEVFDTIQTVILYIFLVEIILRLIIAYEHKDVNRHLANGWTIFDIVVVGSGFIPSNFQKLSNILRIFRVFRILRVIQAFPDIKLIVSIILKSIPRMGTIGALLLILMYTYSIIGIELFGEKQPEFSGFHEAFVTLFTELSGEGWPEIRARGVAHFGYWPPTIYHVSWVLISSILIFNLFIGVVLDSFSAFRQLEMNRKRFLQLDQPNEYTLVLGWNKNIAFVLKNLTEANLSVKISTIVVLAEKEFDDMDTYVLHRVHSELDKDKIYTEIIPRQGDCRSAHDLSLVINENCKSIILMPEQSLVQDKQKQLEHDLHFIDIITNLSAVFHTKNLKVPPIVGTYYDSLDNPFPKDERIIPLDEIVTINPLRLTSKVLSQYSISRRASEVIEQLFSYDGSEIYLCEVTRARIPGAQPKVIGKKVKDIRGRYHPSVVLGWMNQQHGRDYELHFCSNDTQMEYRLQEGDFLILLAEDDSSIRYHRRSRSILDKIKLTGEPGSLSVTTEQHILITGWGEIVRQCLRILGASNDKLKITLATDNANERAEIAEFCEPLNLELVETVVATKMEDCFRLIKEASPGYFDTVLIVTSEIFELNTDIRDILNVLRLRELAIKREDPVRIIMEVNNDKFIPTVNMLSLQGVLCPDEFIMGYLSLLSEDHRLQEVYRRINDCNQSRISIVEPDKVSAQDEFVAMGVYRKKRGDDGQKILLCPDREDFTFEEGDQLIVLSPVSQKR